jgi:hypothetical protein
MGLFHPPVRDETTPLDRKRLGVAVLALVIFALSFMPVPIREIVVVDGARLEEGAPPEPPPAQESLTVDSGSHAPTHPAPGR